MRPAPLAAAGLAVLVLAACAGSGEPRPRPTVKAGEFGTPDCFLRRAASDFQVLDDRNVIVFAPGRADAYHVQVSLPLTDLRFADTLAFESRSSRICGYAGDELVVASTGSSLRRASVTGVYRLEPAALDGLLARFGRGRPAAKPEPRAGEGAEIERDVGGAGGP